MVAPIDCDESEPCVELANGLLDAGINRLMRVVNDPTFRRQSVAAPNAAGNFYDLGGLTPMSNYERQSC